MEPGILIITTGGTIDDLEYSDESKAPSGRASIIPRLLGETGLGRENMTIEQLMLKDSAFITDVDRKTLLNRIQTSSASRILITHGTKTMVVTAKFLGPHIAKKTVVLTGCMTLPSVDNSKDAIASLKFALESFKTLPSGVYVAMHGRIFDWKNVRKNIEKGVFETEKRSV